MTLGSNSTLHVGTAAVPAAVNIGMYEYSNTSYGTSGSVTGELDATLGVADFHLSDLNVGYGMGLWEDTTATGTLRWDQSNPLYAENVYFGRGGSSTGILDVPASGTFLLGDEANPVSLLAISYNDTYGQGTSYANLDFTVTNPIFEAHIGGDLSIGRKMSQSGADSADGKLTLGSNSTLYVGTSTAPAVVNIGTKRSGGGDAIGVLDATQGTAHLYLTEMNVGWKSSSGGTATGTLSWNQDVALHANEVYFGRGKGTGNLYVPSGGTFLLGTEVDPVSLLAISYNDTIGIDGSNADLDFTVTDPFFEAYIGDDLSIGRVAGWSMSATAEGSMTLGSNSTLHVGTAAVPAVVNIGMYEYHYIGHGIAGEAMGELDATQGTVDFHLSELNVGRGNELWGGSTATGTLITGPGSTIRATTINTGTGKNATGTITTGSGSVTTATTVNVGTGKNVMGTVNMAGGLLAAESINMGAGGVFNFINGRLSIGTFNTYNDIGSLDQQSGTLAPGFSHTETSLAGLATINGDYLLASAGTLEIELFGLMAGSEYDKLFVNGAVNLNADSGIGGILNVELGFAPGVGDEFIVLENDDGINCDLISGTFAGLPEGAVFYEEYNGSYYPFRISYIGYTGNDVVLTSIIPVPGASILAGVGILVSSCLLHRQNAKGIRRRKYKTMLSD